MPATMAFPVLRPEGNGPRSETCDSSTEPRPRPKDGEAETAVRLAGLSKRFPGHSGWRGLLRGEASRGSVVALDGVDLAIPRGEFFGLLGPNGAGKTTLFKILATIVLPDRGRATVLGNDVQMQPHRVRTLLAPVISDERSLYWRLSGRQNLELFDDLYGHRGRGSAARHEALLETVGLRDHADRLVGSYSSGLRQRLLVARALLAEPEVLLLDEPTRSLDPVSARSLRRFLRDELAGRRGCTVILATHSAEEAFGLCDRVGILDHGRLLETGPAELLARRYGGEWIRARVRSIDSSALADLAVRGLVEEVRLSPADADGWMSTDFRLRGGEKVASAVLARLTFAGADIASFERVPVSLADLIEQVTGAAKREAS
ncbi:MAG: ABC transporter ATP-binding protein [Gemmatimonadota bacterium]